MQIGTCQARLSQMASGDENGRLGAAHIMFCGVGRCTPGSVACAGAHHVLWLLDDDIELTGWCFLRCSPRMNTTRPIPSPSVFPLPPLAYH
eukprot:268198-Pleurochrysis_carterae.AAC.1